MERKARAPPQRAARAGSTLGRAVLMVLCALCVMSAAVATASAADPRFVGTFDGTATPDGSFGGGNSKVAVDETTGDVYVMDATHDVIDRFTSAGVYLSQIRGVDTTNRTFNFDTFGLASITVDNSGGAGQGNLYAGSWFAGRVFAFDPTGRELWEAPGGSRTCGITVDPSGNIWIGDRDATGLTQLSPADGTPTGVTIPTPGIEPCHAAFAPSGAAYISGFQDRLDKYTAPPGSAFDLTIAGPPSNTWDVATSFRRNDVFSAISILGFQRFRQFDSQGNVLSSIDPGPTSDFEGVAVDGVHNRAFVSDMGLSNIQIYDISAQAPSVTPGRATDITKNSATLNGSVNPNGSDATDCHFDYGTTTSYGSQAPCSPAAPIRGTDDVVVRAAVTGLTPGTTYHYRLVATNAGGTSRTGDVTFRTTPVRPPSPVTTDPASGITETGATLNGRVNPNGDATTCRFQYGTTTAYGTELATASPGGGSSAVAVNVAATGLTAGTTYHVRLVCTNGGGTTNGSDVTFTTTSPLPPPPPPPPPPPTRTCATDASLCRTALALSGYSAGLLRVTCTGDAGGTCRGSLTLKAKVRYKVKRGRRTVHKTRTITVGTVSYSVAVGSSASLRLTLSSAAKSALKKSALTATADGASGSVKIPKTRPARRRARHRKK
jgi:hypothetical protein